MLEVGRRRDLVAIECKSAASRLDPAALLAFRRKHPGGINLVATLHPSERHAKTVGDIVIESVPFLDLPARLDALLGAGRR